MDDLVHTDTNTVDWTKAAIMIKNVSTAKTIIHVCLDAVHDVNNSAAESVADVPLSETEDSFVRKTFSSKLILNKPHVF